jgi:UDP-GlcNAc:undecaprenyl-phosphate/decaprenyl-phosphate GlcNAc-1-phosphate transferase
MIVFALVLFCIVIFVFSMLVNDFLLKYLRNIGTDNTNGEIRWSSTRKPAIGGITFFICFLLASISLIYTIPQTENFNFEQFYGIMLALSVGFLAGLFDDAYNTIPWLKLLLQIVCGVALALTGSHIDVFESMTLNYMITVVWVVGIMNAINLLDNMDAISTIVSFFVVIAFMASIIILEYAADQYFLILLGISASLLAFFRYNWHPSKMYMGDTGSMFLGVLIAGFGIIYFWNFNDNSGTIAPLFARLTAVACIFALPITDTSTVIFKRIFIFKKSPFKGGKDHTTHHLSYLGLSDTKVAIVFISLSIVNTLAGLFVILSVENNQITSIIISGSWFLLEFTALFIISMMNIKKDETE